MPAYNSLASVPSVGGVPSGDVDSPLYRRPESVEALPDLTLIADLLAGTRRMWQQRQRYIRAWTAEDPSVYEIRSQCETLYEGLARVLSSSVGMMFSRPPVLAFSSPAVELVVTPHWANIDGAGTAGAVWAKRFAEMAVRDGLALILVDHPPRPDGTVTLADEVRLSLRPTWAAYERQAILAWRTETLDNAETVTMVTLYEPTTVADGVYGVKMVERVRVLEMIEGVPTWRLIEIDGTKVSEVGNGIYRDRTGRPLRQLPIAVAYTGSPKGPFNVRPPLMGVAWANLAHYQLSSELRFYTDLSAFPQPTVIGSLANNPTTGLPQSLAMGPLVGVHLTAGSDFRWTEVQGTSFTALADRVKEKLEAMASLGLAFLSGEDHANQTAAARRLDATAENATIATAAQGIEDALNMALEIHAAYLGVPADAAPVITISKEYDSTALDAQTMAAIGALVREGMPKVYAVKLLQEGGRLDADADPFEVAMEWDASEAAQDVSHTIPAELEAR
jgi:hypothetical protein